VCGKRREVADPELVSAILSGGSPPLAPYPNNETSDVHAMIRRHVDGLRPEIRAVHWHRYVLGDTQHTAAKALGLSRQTLRTLELRLVTDLRRQLAVTDDEHRYQNVHRPRWNASWSTSGTSTMSDTSSGIVKARIRNMAS
jgi:DNA-directed RNA polymerase specialized sigma24 family protein